METHDLSEPYLNIHMNKITESSLSTNHKIMIGVGVFLVLVGLGVGLYFALRKKDEKKNDNIKIALKAIGYTKESYDNTSSPIDDKEFCMRFNRLIYDEHGFKILYKNITGKEYTKTPYNCNNANRDDRVASYYSDILKECINKLLDDNNYYHNLVAMYLVFLVGFLAILLNITPRLIIKINFKEDKEVDTIELRDMSMVGRNTTDSSIQNAPFVTPSKMIRTINSISLQQLDFTPSPVDEENKKKALRLVNMDIINKLENNTDTKMSINTLGEILVYSISKLYTLIKF
jgi:hypothetical protein